MTPRKASLRVAHQGNCPHAGRTALESLKKVAGCTCSQPEWPEDKPKPKGTAKCAGCTCQQPSFYVMHRDASGATRKSARVKDRRVADRLLREKQVEIDKGHAGYEERRNVTFPEWVETYKEILESRPGIRATTESTYGRSLAFAVDAIGHVQLRALGPADLRKFHKKIGHASDATVGKHLTHLGACLAAAVDEGLADKNPVPAFRKSLRLRPGRGTPPYTDGEAERLLNALGGEEAVYVAIVRAALELGARIGELIALEWSNVDLTNGVVRIRSTYSGGVLSAPKDVDERDVYLTATGQKMLADWIAETGARSEGLVFPAPRSGGYMNDGYLRKLVLEAWKPAGIQKVDVQSGRPRKPLHSLRATFARRMLEQGRNPLWVREQMGHADLELTIGVYGAWSAEAMRAEATRQIVVS